PAEQAGLKVGDTITIFDLFAFHARDGVADFQASLLGRASRYHVLNGHTTTVDPIDTSNRRILLRREFNSDRSARNPVFRTNELVVNLHHGVRRQGEADPGVRTG